MAEKKTERVCVKGLDAASTFQSSVLMNLYGLTIDEAKQLKVGAVIYLDSEKARKLFNAGLCVIESQIEPDISKEVEDG